MRQSKTRATALQKVVLNELIHSQPSILLKRPNKGFSDMPIFVSAAEERQTKLF